MYIYVYMYIYITIYQTIGQSRHTHTKVFTRCPRAHSRGTEKWTLQLNFRYMHIDKYSRASTVLYTRRQNVRWGGVEGGRGASRRSQQKIAARNSPREGRNDYRNEKANLRFTNLVVEGSLDLRAESGAKICASAFGCFSSLITRSKNFPTIVQQSYLLGFNPWRQTNFLISDEGIETFCFKQEDDY